jgi:F-box protein 9
LDHSGASAIAPSTAHASLAGVPTSLSSLLSEYSQLSIQGEPAPTSLSPAPPCPISTLPEELLVEILLQLAIDDVAALVRLSLVCKRLAYVTLTEERIWKRISLGPEVGFAAMHYDWNCRVDGSALGDDGAGGRLLSDLSSLSLFDIEETHPIYRYAHPMQSISSLVPSPYKNYLSLFRLRPRVRFGGVYISTVNYTRPGATSATQVTWNSPVLIVTYYRYLRFFRDGTVISLLTTSEPGDVVQHMAPENVHKNHSSGVPQYVMREALRGRWKLSGPADTEHHQHPRHPSQLARLVVKDEEAVQPEPRDEEAEGTLHVETEGAVPKYMYRMALSVGSAGKGTKSNKLSWQGYWSYNKLTDDWGEFGLKNDRPFYWSRVKRFASA